MFRFQIVKLLLFRSGNDALFILEHKVMAADHNALPAHAACNAVGHNVLYLGMHLLVGNAALLGSTHHGVCHGMREVLFQAGGQLENFLLITPGERHNLDHFRTCMGQGTGLIKHNSIRLGQGFQILASLDGDVVGTAFTHSRQHGQRHGKFKCAREIDHQNRDCAGYVAGERIGHDRTSQTPRHQAIRQLQGVVFRAGLELFGLFDHRYDLIVTAGTIHGVCSKNAFAFLNNSTCINCRTRNLAYRHRLTGQGRLVDHGFALDNGAIKRHHVARTHNDLVPRLDLGDGHQNFGSLTAHPNTVNVQGHAASQIIQALFACPFFQQSAHIEQEHNGTGGIKVTAQQRYTDRKCIQHFHFQLAMPQADQTTADKFNCFEHRDNGLHRSRQKQLAERTEHHQVDKTFLVFLVDLTAVSRSNQ